MTHVYGNNMAKTSLSSEITNLDFIKTFAVICMIIDHIGFYFFPDVLWFRAVGRLGGVPIWFFLIGYANSRHIPNSWLIGALILAVMDLFLFSQVFAMNVLVTIVLLRLGIDHIMNFVLQSRYIFWFAAILLAFFYIPTNMVLEYGTLAVICAMLGYMVRHKERLYALSFVTKYDYMAFIAFMVVANTILQTSVFGFSVLQEVFLFLATAAITYILIAMEPTTYPQIKEEKLKTLLRFGGRKTLEIYVAHLVVFKILFWGLVVVGFYR